MNIPKNTLSGVWKNISESILFKVIIFFYVLEGTAQKC